MSSRPRASGVRRWGGAADRIHLQQVVRATRARTGRGRALEHAASSLTPGEEHGLVHHRETRVDERRAGRDAARGASSFG